MARPVEAVEQTQREVGPHHLVERHAEAGPGRAAEGEEVAQGVVGTVRVGPLEERQACRGARRRR